MAAAAAVRRRPLAVMAVKRALEGPEPTAVRPGAEASEPGERPRAPVAPAELGKEDVAAALASLAEAAAVLITEGPAA